MIWLECSIQKKTKQTKWWVTGVKGSIDMCLTAWPWSSTDMGLRSALIYCIISHLTCVWQRLARYFTNIISSSSWAYNKTTQPSPRAFRWDHAIDFWPMEFKQKEYTISRPDIKALLFLSPFSYQLPPDSGDLREDSDSLEDSGTSVWKDSESPNSCVE